MKWAEISIQTSHEATEAVAEIFHELGASGVLIEDPELVNTYIHSGAWDYTDIPLAEETEVVTVKAWLPTDEDLPSKLEQLRLHIDEMSQFLDKGSGVINCSEIQDEDWANNWKQFFHPERIGEKIVVKPSWEEYTPLDNDIVIELDPGMAFGTGTHATTSMCIQLLEEYVKPEMKVFDVGTGSGILAIAASKLGAKDIEAADYDNVAVDVARENIEKNHECENIKIFQSDLLKNICIKSFAMGKFPEIPDVALDKHTVRGKAMGRDSFHFLHEASKVIPQMEVDNDYKERYAKILEEYDPENVVDTAFTFNGWQF